MRDSRAAEDLEALTGLGVTRRSSERRDEACHAAGGELRGPLKNVAYSLDLAYASRPLSPAARDAAAERRESK